VCLLCASSDGTAHVCAYCAQAVMGLLMWPCLSYHNLLDRVRHKIDGVVGHFEQKLYISRKQRPHKGMFSSIITLVIIRDVQLTRYCVH